MYKKQTIDNKNGNILENVYTGIAVGSNDGKDFSRVCLVGVTAVRILLPKPVKIDGLEPDKFVPPFPSTTGTDAAVDACADVGIDIIN